MKRDGPSDSFGTIHAALSGIPGALAAVRIDLRQNGQVVDSRTLVTSTGVDAGPPTGGPAADAFFVLPAGIYTAAAIPLDASGNVAKACDGTSKMASVVPSQTTEIGLLVSCGGASTGGLDVSVNVRQAPTIVGLDFDPSKFAETCAGVHMTVDARDSAGDSLTYAWSLVASPPASDTQKGGQTSLQSQGSSAWFFTDVAGDYTLSVTATDRDQQTATLNFPVHIVQGSTAVCNPIFDQKNLWSPAGPARPGLAYGTRAHIMPTAPGPDPVCHLTRHDDNPTILSPVVVPVLWGTGIPVADAQNLTNMFTDLLTNPAYAGYLRALSDEYGTGWSGSVKLPTGSMSGSTAGWTITPDPSHTSSEWSLAEVQAELYAQMNAGGFIPQPDGPGVRTIYALYFPSAVTLTLGDDKSCSDFLAYHSSFNFFGADATFMAIGACGNEATLELEGSHELIEAMTDPLIPRLTWYDDTDTNPDCAGEIGDICRPDTYDLGGYNVQASWSNANAACHHVALTPRQHMLRVTLSKFNFHTTGFSLGDHPPTFHPLSVADGVFDCRPGDAATVRNLGCIDGTGYFATVRCNEGTNGFIDGSLQLDISSSCSSVVPVQNYESLVGNPNPSSKLTPLTFSASETVPYASTDATTLCGATEINNTPGSCTCPDTSASNDECRRALNVCFSGSNVGDVDPCSRQEIAADVNAHVMPAP